MSQELIDFMFKFAGISLVALTLTIIILSASSRKKIAMNARKISKTSGKVSKNVMESMGNYFKKRDSKKNQLPGGIRQPSYSQPATTTPQKIPKTGGIIPISVSKDNCPYELVYMPECDGWQLGDEDNGKSIAFRCVGGIDNKTGKLKIWIYSPHYHKDKRKEKSSYRVNNYGAIEREY